MPPLLPGVRLPPHLGRCRSCSCAAAATSHLLNQGVGGACNAIHHDYTSLIQHQLQLHAPLTQQRRNGAGACGREWGGMLSSGTAGGILPGGAAQWPAALSK
jgi:hypothetical protein